MAEYLLVTLKSGRKRVIAISEGSSGETELEKIRAGHADYRGPWIRTEDNVLVNLAEIVTVEIKNDIA